MVYLRHVPGWQTPHVIVVRLSQRFFSSRPTLDSSVMSMFYTAIWSLLPCALFRRRFLMTLSWRPTGSWHRNLVEIENYCLHKIENMNWSLASSTRGHSFTSSSTRLLQCSMYILLCGGLDRRGGSRQQAYKINTQVFDILSWWTTPPQPLGLYSLLSWMFWTLSI